MMKKLYALVAALIVNGPKEKFSDTEIYKIDQFVLRGGNVIFFVDSIDEIMPSGCCGQGLPC